MLIITKIIEIIINLLYFKWIITIFNPAPYLAMHHRPISISCTAFLAVVFSLSTAHAQRSPSELADLPLERLLGLSTTSASSFTQPGPEGPAVSELPALSRFALSYHYKQRQFEGYRDGTTEVSFREVLEIFPVLPTEITQEAHIFQTHYRHSDKLGLTLGIPYILQSTAHIRRAGAPFTLESEDFGDLSLYLGYTAFQRGTNRTILNLGAGFPTGSIDEKGDTPRGPNTQLPYAMQTGSGTYDLRPGIIHTKALGPFALGAAVNGVIRLGKNDRDYRLGDSITAAVWAGYRVAPWADVSVRFEGECWGSIEGQDPDVNPAIAPVADPDLYGGCRIDTGLGLKLYHPASVYRDRFVEIAFQTPIWQDLNGPQTEKRWEFTVGAGFSF